MIAVGCAAAAAVAFVVTFMAVEMAAREQGVDLAITLLADHIDKSSD